MNKKMVKKVSFMLLILALFSFQSVVYGAVTVLPEPNTDPELLEIVQKVVDYLMKLLKKN